MVTELLVARTFTYKRLPEESILIQRFHPLIFSLINAPLFGSVLGFHTLRIDDCITRIRRLALFQADAGIEEIQNFLPDPSLISAAIMTASDLPGWKIMGMHSCQIRVRPYLLYRSNLGLQHPDENDNLPISSREALQKKPNSLLVSAY